MRMKFEQPEWFVCDHSLRVENPGTPMSAPPAEPGDWPSLGQGSTARKAQEEVLETLLIRNLDVIFKERLRFLFRGGDYWGIQDITALDNLGRFHLFELKRDAVKAVVAEQLGAYLLGGLFQSPQEALDELWSMSVEGLPPRRWALFLAAALSNDRTSNAGATDVNQWHPRVVSGEVRPYDKSRWGELYRGGESDRWLTEAFLAKSKSRVVASVTMSEIEAWSEHVYHSLTREKPFRPPFRPRGHAVIWLVGRGFDDLVFKQVRLWRRAGLDARCLAADARQSIRTGKWVLSIQREAFPERKDLLDQLAAIQPELEGESGILRYDLGFYDSRPPSDKKVEEGGLPLGREAFITVRGCDHGEKRRLVAEGAGPA